MPLVLGKRGAAATLSAPVMQERCNRCSAELAEGANYCARCGALVAGESSERTHDALLGRVLLGRYRVQRLLGEGGMGRVYLAEQTIGQATRPVAIKTLRKELIRDPKGSGRFQRESEIVIRLAHPNTIQFYDFAELDDGTAVIVMEYIEGRTLGEVLRDEPCPTNGTRTLLTQICGSLGRSPCARHRASRSQAARTVCSRGAPVAAIS